MQKVGDFDFVVTLISDEFLNSSNCMYGVSELMRDREFSQRMLQMILPNAKIHDIQYHIDLIRKWQNRRNKLVEESKTIEVKSVGHIAKELKELDNICTNITSFLEAVKAQNSPDYDVLKENNFRELIDFIWVSLTINLWMIFFK